MFQQPCLPEPGLVRGYSIRESSVSFERFGQFLRKTRESRRLSLGAVEAMSRDLAARVSKSHLSRLETGHAVPTLPRMSVLSRIYGIPVSLLAQRLESCLKPKAPPSPPPSGSPDAILVRAVRLRTAGHHREALPLFEALLDSYQRQLDDTSLVLADLRLEHLNCLVKLSREDSAKEHCETLLNSTWLTERQKVIALQYFAICCYRLGRLTVARMATDSAKAKLARLPRSEDLCAHLSVVEGNLLFATNRVPEAVTAYQSALRGFKSQLDELEACRTALNLAAAMVELGSGSHVEVLLRDTLETTIATGHKRQQAYALSHLALLAFGNNSVENAQTYCLRSNHIARPRGYISILFRNCYYLWRAAQLQSDGSARKTHERTLLKHLSEVEDNMPEAEAFRTHVKSTRKHRPIQRSADRVSSFATGPLTYEHSSWDTLPRYPIIDDPEPVRIVNAMWKRGARGRGGERP